MNTSILWNGFEVTSKQHPETKILYLMLKDRHSEMNSNKKIHWKFFWQSTWLNRVGFKDKYLLRVFKGGNGKHDQQVNNWKIHYCL